MRNNKTTGNVDRIAIVGVACRFPGGIVSLEDFWQVLSEGRDAVTEIGPERFGVDFYRHPDRRQPGKSYAFAAGVLDDVDRFDADFFGISPREAEQMDPQQRLLLELTWEALENGGQVPEKLAGSDCAVYVGIASTDYAYRRIDDLSSMDAYTMTGSTASIASNRISYLFDFRGPSVSVDTACSSSLVALHHACQAIRNGDAGMAIAGGVNMLLHPFAFVGFSKASMLSPRGRCRTFDAGGDGYVRSEGAAVLFLKPLEQAEADGDPIHGVIVASGINADGRTNGMTVPGHEQQGRLLRSIYHRSGVDAERLVYLEAHGTGTAVGDPIETRAIGEVLGQMRPAGKPLPIGSVKTNLGHMETAAGMAGLLKGMLVLRHASIPPTLHVQNLNPAIDFDGYNLEVVTQLTPLPDMEKPRLAGVNSFGFGGANAHVLIEEYRPTRSLMPQPGAWGVTQAEKTVLHADVLPLPPLLLSARGDEALRDMALRYARRLETVTEPQGYYDLAWSARHHRQHLSHALAVQAESVPAIAETLRAFAAGDPLPKVDAARLYQAEKREQGAKLVLVFSGNGSQWQGMGQVLLAHSEVFRTAVQAVDQLLSRWSPVSLLAEFQRPAAESCLEQTEIAQPLLFAFQVGAVRVLESLGVRYQAVTGHSVGEVAAAWASGALSLEQAAWVIHERSKAQGQTRGQGRMAAVGLGRDAVRQLLAELGLASVVEIAGYNSPDAVTVSAPLADLETLGVALKAQGRFFRILDLDYAFHSHRMDPVKQGLLDALRTLEPQAQERGITFVSTVYGRETAASRLGADYWWDNIREPVAFHAALDYLIGADFRVFLEVGPHPILRSYVQACLQARDVSGQVTGLDKRGGETPDCLQRAGFGLLLQGVSSDWSVHFPQPGRYVALPHYPWQKERHWYPLTSEGYDLVNRRRVHPLLGYPLHDAEAAWENTLDTATLPWLAGHVVDGAVVFPAAAYVEMALAASALWHGTDTHVLEHFEIRAPVMLDEGQTRTLRFLLEPADGRFRIVSRVRLSEDAWTEHVVGRITGQVWKDRADVRLPDTAELMAQAREVLEGEEHYRLAASVGLGYRDGFRGVQRVWADPADQVLADITCPASLQADAGQYLLHPALLDAGFQLLVDIFRTSIRAGQLAAMIPVRIGKLNLFRPHGGIARIQARLRHQGPRSVVADFLVLDGDGQLVAELEATRFKGVRFARQQHALPGLYEFVPRLQPLLLPGTPAPEMPVDLLAQAVQTVLQQREDLLQRARHNTQVVPLFDVLAACYAWQAIQALCGERCHAIDPVALMQQHGIAAEYRPLVERLFRLLAEDGLAQQHGGLWSLATDADQPAARDVWLAILGGAPAYLPELVLLGRCGEHLLQVLSGELECDALLEPAKSSTHEHWQDSAPTFRAVNLGLAEVLVQLVQDWPDNRRLRILELGGDGTLTHALLPVLPTAYCDYVFASAQPELLEALQAEFDEYACFSTALLEADFRGEGYEALREQPFDVLLSGDALQVWNDAVSGLMRLKHLLKPQGLLAMANAADSRLFDLTQGLRPQWWVALENADDEATGKAWVSRLFSPDEWRSQLAQSGFTAVEHVFEPQDTFHGSAFLTLALADTVVPAMLEQGSVVSAGPDAAPDGAVSTEVRQTQGWLILADGSGYSRRLAERLQAALQARDMACELAFGLEGLRLERFAEIVQLSGLPEPGVETRTGTLQHLQENGPTLTLALVQQLDRLGISPRLWLVTLGATGLDGGAVELSQAPLWGLGRVLMNEHPDLDCHLLDLQPALSEAQAAQLLWQEFCHGDGETEVLLGVQRRQVLRMRRVGGLTQTPDDERPQVTLDFTAPGPLKNLYWRALPGQDLQPDEVEILPLAAGLNFRDVMYAMGLLSDEAVENGFAGAALGMELSGAVMRVGAAVRDFQPGDAVIGFAPACFSTRVITRTTAVAHRPVAWTDEEAATVPTTFFTVYYALQQLAQLQPGERILIHGASGGVGLAAIQFARYVGAEIFATAGTDEKRDFVRLMGADHVLDSRSLHFAEDILHITAGEGVDVVLNSISGEAINKNLDILRPFGRFLELGKRDFYENSRIGLRPFRNNISYFGIDADQLLIERPDMAGRLFRDMMQLFADGVLRPLPHRVFPASRIREAFRYVQQSRQVGKVIVSFKGAGLRPTFAEPVRQSLALASQGTYLVTGGLSGFGLRTAQWLADKGAKTLVLLSRSGLSRLEAHKAVNELRARGVRVEVFACDVADPSALAAVFAEVQASLPPMRGIVHAAMVLEDAILRNMTPDSFRRVLAPKLVGGWNLHELSRGLPLDFFVLYSSITTFIGNPGQANYVAANMALESLVRLRRQEGLPASFAAWGPLDDTGYLARNREVRDALQARLGGEALTSTRALEVLEKLILSGHPGLAVIDMDWSVVQRVMPAARSPKYADLRRLLRGGDEHDQAEDIQTLITGLAPEQVHALVTDLLIAEVGEILRLPREKLSADKSVFDLGMDSLMGMELVMAIEERFGVRLPVMALTEGATIHRIAEKISAGLLSGSEAAATGSVQQSVADVARRHGTALSEEQLARLAASVDVDEAANAGPVTLPAVRQG
ncbi:MAG TPA: SDR family NAD(P)-dependent oxidoreductase [Thiolinea sp.]|nr:SDR family NAD(P)-dependent oxidoreductase [Thiolinea sp.]